MRKTNARNELASSKANKSDLETDSFTINRNNVFVFQITIGNTHPVKEKGLDMIVQLWKDKFPDHFFN